MKNVLDQMKQAKMQWVQDPSQSNIDNLNNVRREASRHFRKKKKAYLRDKIDELVTNSKTKILATCIGASMTLSRVTNLGLI
jgi:response regulator of citrate/malate metabolism